MHSNKGIFRQEAVEHQKNKWSGKALLLSGAPAKVIALLAVAFILILVLFIVFGSYTRRINVLGEVITQPHAINLFSPQQGIISRSFVKEGQLLSKDDHIYEIDLSRVTSSGNVSTQAITATKDQISQTNTIISQLQANKETTVQNLQSQIGRYEKTLTNTQEMLEESKKGLDTMRKAMKNYEDYQKKGLISRDQAINQQYMYFQQQNTYQNLFNQSNQEQLYISNLQSDIITKAIDFDTQIAQYASQNSDLQRKLAELEASKILLINAPADGRIESLSVTEGQMVNANDSLAQLVPRNDNAFFLVLWMPNNSIPFIAKGDGINIRYEAFPFEKFGQFKGTIDSISDVPASVQEMSTYKNIPLSYQGQVVEPYYKVIVKLAGNQFQYQDKTLKLSSGMKAQSTVFLEKRPIYQWMVTPFYNIKKSLTGPISE